MKPELDYETIYGQYEFCKLYYVASENVITDDEGDIVYDVYDYISPNELYLFKLNKKNIITESRYGQIVELIYFDDPEYQL